VCETRFHLANASKEHCVEHSSFRCGVTDVLSASDAHGRRNLHDGPIGVAAALRPFAPNLGEGRLRQAKQEPDGEQSDSLVLPKHGAV
jgi:hypothetical protein